MKTPTVAEVVEAMKAEILASIADPAGRIPASVSDFSELHDYCDANMIADDLFTDEAEEATETEAESDARMAYWLETFTTASYVIDAWLKAGRPTRCNCPHQSSLCDYCLNRAVADTY